MKDSGKEIATISIILIQLLLNPASGAQTPVRTENKGQTQKQESHDRAKAGKNPIEHEDHDHSKDEQDAGHHEEHNHAKENKESAHEHGHEESRNNVGPNKGVTEANEDVGFILKDKVEKNFAIQKQQLTNKGPFVVPTQALVFSGREKQVFRYRDRYWKAVDVKITKKEAKTSAITSDELAPGDSIAITGVGFLKIIEQSVFGPAIEGHVH